MLTVIKKTRSGRVANVTIEGLDMEELESQAAKQMAIDESGLHNAGLTFNSSAIYPVDANGDDVVEYAPGAQAVTRWRKDFEVMQGL